MDKGKLVKIFAIVKIFNLKNSLKKILFIISLYITHWNAISNSFFLVFKMIYEIPEGGSPAFSATILQL